MSNPETPRDDTVRLEQTVQTEPTEQLDTSDPTRAIGVDEAQPAEAVLEDATADQAAADQTPADQPAPVGTAAGTAAWPPAVPERPSGPHAPAIVLGLVCLAIAVIVFAQELGSLSVDWGDVGPVGIVATGAVLVLFGLVGLLTSRRKTSD
ncbi:hypothetical protein [Pedococcus bigeumensis]|uniref:Uncharacterized protein n=1 Tax=Pedococcus bigeumensis TaxID=433644 RepID=A0A502D0J3_9MICO|nr:hypothetical protein [Pedococcus bigeumensis]TPG19047.1 hypothetical protein EAH86_00560 [Pedococcus bigeumensis]